MRLLTHPRYKTDAINPTASANRGRTDQDSRQTSEAMRLQLSENRTRWKDPLGTMLDSIKTLPMQTVPAGLMTSQKPVPRDGAACPHCHHPLQVRVRSGFVLVPLASGKEGPIQLKCRSRKCKGLWIDVEVQDSQIGGDANGQDPRSPETHGPLSG